MSLNSIPNSTPKHNFFLDACADAVMFFCLERANGQPADIPLSEVYNNVRLDHQEITEAVKSLVNSETLLVDFNEDMHELVLALNDEGGAL